MSKCDVCGLSSPILIKGDDGLRRCSNCFTVSSPVIDEGWRILKTAMDNMEWEDIYMIEKIRSERKRKYVGRNKK